MVDLKKLVFAVAAAAALMAGSEQAVATPVTASVCSTAGCAPLPPPLAAVLIIGPPVVKALKNYKCKAHGFKITCKRR